MHSTRLVPMHFLSQPAIPTRKAAVNCSASLRRDTDTGFSCHKHWCCWSVFSANFEQNRKSNCASLWSSCICATKKWPWPREGKFVGQGCWGGREGSLWPILWPAAGFNFSPAAPNSDPQPKRIKMTIHQEQLPLTPTTAEGFDTAWAKHVMSEWFVK